MTTRVVGYVRVSTVQQAETGVSLDAQTARLKAYCVALNLELVGIQSDDGFSAKSLDRPGLQRALASLKNGQADALLVTKLDRLTRSVKDLGLLIDTYFASNDSSLLSLGDNIDTRSASGRLILNVLMSVAQWEREATSERTREALKQVKIEGGRIGPAPLGQQRSGHLDENGRLALSIDTTETETVARILGLDETGSSLREIVEVLNTEGRKTKRGGKWAAETVRRVIARSQRTAA